MGLNELPPEYRQNLENSELNSEMGSQQSENAELLESNLYGENIGSLPQATERMKIMTPLTVANLEKYLKSFEKELIETALYDAAGINSFMAERLGVEEESLQQKLKAFNLKID